MRRFWQDMPLRQTGVRAPEWLLERLERLYPQFRLWWAPTARCWILVQIHPWPPLCYQPLVGEPTEANTLQFLAQATKHWNKGKRYVERMLRRNEESQRASLERGKKPGREKIEEGHDLLRNVIKGKVTVPVEKGE